jgi:Na+/phosphate symporter
MADRHASLTYPSFLGLLWLLQAMRPALAVAIGEGLVVVVEGSIIYAMCGLLAPTAPDLPRPPLAKCWLASLVGNVCSAVAFPVLFALFKIIERSGSG